MLGINKVRVLDIPMFLAVLFLVGFSLLILNSIASSIFPVYYFYIILGFSFFYLFSKIDFEIISLFSIHLYILSLLLLILTLVIGQVTRGAIRWIPLGPITIQPAEIVRPFLFLFLANKIADTNFAIKEVIKILFLFALPAFLIVVQPSLGVAILTTVGFLGMLLASSMDKKKLFALLLIALTLIPLAWQVLAPYQKLRILTFLNPTGDPQGAGYNAIQSIISVGSGKLLGKGLGKGVQTQLAFLPEKHTDFIFASVSEEMGFMGSTLVIGLLFFILHRITIFLQNPSSLSARIFVMAVFLTLLTQIFINLGMNLGILPITGLPLPLFSAGGSSFLGTMILLGMALSTKSKISA